MKNQLTDKPKLENPYQLVWYNVNWSETKTAKNNAKYWKWEVENNNLKL